MSVAGIRQLVSPVLPVDPDALQSPGWMSRRGRGGRWWGTGGTLSHPPARYRSFSAHRTRAPRPDQAQGPIHPCQINTNQPTQAFLKILSMTLG